MANINKIRLSGQTYNIQDPNASKTVELTQAQYDALTVKDPNTFYVITDAQGADLSNYYTKSETSGATQISTALASKADAATTYTKSEVDTALASKQTTLTAGTGISIVDNVISATGGGGITEDDELLLSTALTDLNDRKIDASEIKSNYQKKGDYVTTSTLNTRLAEYETALDEQNVEEVTAYALNDLNERFGGLKIVKITESEYTALTTKDENTLYIVVADPS